MAYQLKLETARALKRLISESDGLGIRRVTPLLQDGPAIRERFEWAAISHAANTINLTVHTIPFYDILMTPCEDVGGVLLPVTGLAVDFTSITDETQFYAVLELDLNTLDSGQVLAAGLASATKLGNAPADNKVRFNLHRWLKAGTAAHLVARCREEVAIRPQFAPPRIPS